MLGDRLIVMLSTDDFNKIKNKKSVFTYDQRKTVLDQVVWVNAVVPETSWSDKEKYIREFEVDIFAQGDDWAGKFDDLKGFCEVVYLPRTPEISSTLIKKNIKKND